MKRVFLGGSFDPVHDGHLQMICHVFDKLSSSKLPFTIDFLPTAGNPFKGKPTNPTHRLAMLSLAVQLLGDKDVIANINTLEIHQAPPVYTINTLNALSHRYPDDEFIFVMGGDSLASLHLWQKYVEILRLTKIWAFARVGSDDTWQDDILANTTCDFNEFLYGDDKAIFYDKTPLPAISSSLIRQNLKDGKTPTHLPEPIFDYIKQHQLYKNVL